MVDRHHPGKAPTAILQALGDGSCRTTAELSESLDLTTRQVSDAAARLSRRDYLIRATGGRYRLTEAGLAAAAAGEVITSGPKGPNKAVQEYRDTLRQRAWRSMHIHRRFTVADLVSDAATGADRNPEDNLYRYLRGLKQAGYVTELSRRAPGTAETSNGYKRWMLARYTGPRAPVVRPSDGTVHDFNTGEDVPCALGR